MRPNRKPPSLRWVIGQHAAYEAIKVRPDWVSEVHVQEDRQRELQSIEQICHQKRIPVRLQTKKYFSSLPEGHQGVVVGLTDRPRWDEACADKEKSLVAFLDGITDPHNLGAILRSAWLLEVDGIFIPKNRAVDLTPVTCKVASGGAEHVPVEAVHFQSQIQWLKDRGYWIFGFSEESQSLLPKHKFPEKSAIIIGAEGKGIRSSTENFCDQQLRIPQADSGSSYNASVAFALSAYEFHRQKFL